MFYHSKVANGAAEPGIREGARPLWYRFEVASGQSKGQEQAKDVASDVRVMSRILSIRLAQPLT